MKRALLILTLLSICIASPALAHKMRVFAYGDSEAISGEAAFGGGKPAKNIEIRVENPENGLELLKTLTDDKGEFTFSVPPEAIEGRFDLTIVAYAGEGHRSEWRLKADDYLPAGADTGTERTEKPSPLQAAPLKEKPGAAEVTTVPPLTEEQLRQIVNQSVAEQLRPIKRQLTQISEPKTSLKDILGGLGYIIGLAGLAAYLKSRKEVEK